MKARVWLAATALAATATIMAMNITAAFADKGGCPNDSAVVGAGKANANSAHGLAKQIARDCVTIGE
jgi:hypothetical protein